MPLADPIPTEDAVVAAEAAVLAQRAAAIPLPGPLLEGWDSLCAAEYAVAALALAASVAAAVDALRAASVPS